MFWNVKNCQWNKDINKPQRFYSFLQQTKNLHSKPWHGISYKLCFARPMMLNEVIGWTHSMIKPMKADWNKKVVQIWMFADSGLNIIM